MNARGSAIAQVEAATFDDVAGLALMSWTDRPATDVTRATVGRQSSACLGGAASAPAAGAADFRQQLFAAAPSGSSAARPTCAPRCHAATC